MVFEAPYLYFAVSLLSMSASNISSIFYVLVFFESSSKTSSIKSLFNLLSDFYLFFFFEFLGSFIDDRSKLSQSQSFGEVFFVLRHLLTLITILRKVTLSMTNML